MSWLMPRSLLVLAAFAGGSYVGATRGINIPKEIEQRLPAREDVAPHVDDLPDPLPWPRLNKECTLHRAWLLAEGPASTGPASTEKKFVTLTFDDGPTADVTPAVLDLLQKHRKKATFFFVGQSFHVGPIEHQKWVRTIGERVAHDGHLVGSHTRTHSLLTQLDHGRALSEIDEGIDAVASVVGKRPVLFRPPYGQLDAFGEEALRARGLELVMWSVEADAKSDADAMFASLRDQIAYAGGGIVLMHDTRPQTPAALAKLLDWLALKKYEIVDLPTFLRETAAHPQPFDDRSALERARAAAWRTAHPAPPKLDEGA